MVDPINYGAMLPQIDFTGLQRGIAMRDDRRQAEALMEQRRAATEMAQAEAAKKAAEEGAWKTAVGDLMKNPSTEGYNALFLRFPDKLNALKAGLEGYTAGQVTRNRNAAMEMLGLVNAGATGAAVKKLKERRTALTEAGESTEITDALIADLESGEQEQINRAKGTAAFALYPMLGEDADKILNTLGMGAQARDREADNDRQERALDLRERQAETQIDQGERRLGLSERAADRADAAAARAERKERGGSGGGTGGYEYRIGPNGKLQRRKVR